MLSTAIGIVVGGVITILTAIFVEALRRPKLALEIAPPGDLERMSPADYRQSTLATLI